MTTRIPYLLYVQQQLAAQLTTITKANGYQNDVGSSVHRGIGLFSGDSEQWSLPMVSILEAPKQEQPLRGGYDELSHKFQWELMIQGWVDDDLAHPTDPAHTLAADVEMAISMIVEMNSTGSPAYPDIYLLGVHPADPSGVQRLISGLRLGIPICRPPQAQISSKAFFYLPVWVELAYNTATSYIDI